jgi:hypothetical protein
LKVQTTVTTSSSEAEFLAADTAPKIAKYICAVRTGLGFKQTAATILYEDNESAITTVNENKPTLQFRHGDIQHFALQEW